MWKSGLLVQEEYGMATILLASKGILVPQLVTQEVTLVKPMAEGGECLAHESIQQKSAPSTQEKVMCWALSRVTCALEVY
jgi:hypothetical protein